MADMLDTQRPLESAKDLSNAAEREPEFCFQKLASLGSFYRLNIKFDATLFQQELKSSDLEWVHYNKAKNWSQGMAELDLSQWRSRW